MPQASPERGPVVFWDCESDCTFAMCPGATRDQQFSHMQITCLCALECDAALCLDSDDPERAIDEGKKLAWWRDVAEFGHDPFDEFLELMDRASVIVAYNAMEFDFPVLRKHYGKGTDAHRRYLRHRQKTLDPFSRIRAATDFWPKLDLLLVHNALAKKTANGIEAIKMWEEGRRDELLYYCHGDVAQMARFCLLREAIYPGLGPLEVSLYSVASALRALNDAPVLAAPSGQKRPREAPAVASSPLDGERFIEVQSPEDEVVDCV